MSQFTNLDKSLRENFLSVNPKPIKYGTAGFRNEGIHMNYIVFRVGAFVTIINKISPSLCLGVVISASHNKIQDNGVKITNFAGNMLDIHYQPILEKFVQQPILQTAVKNLQIYITKVRKQTLFQQKVHVFIGGDNRPSTPELLALTAQGIQSQGGEAINFGLTTTPQLQYYVYYYNLILKPQEVHKLAKDYNIEEIRKVYWENFCSYFLKAAQYIQWNQIKYRSLDCANGVGGDIFPEFAKLISKYLSITLINNTKKQLLNNKCGADYLKTQLKFPINYKKQQHNSFISFDGDADRIIFFIEQQNNIQLIDGDRQGTILTSFFKKMSDQIKNKITQFNQKGILFLQIPMNPTIGFVQTYYANSSSSQYLKNIYGMDPVYTATGVKHLHTKAQHYDIGIYYQANGHGTVIFNKNYLNRLEALIQNRKQLQNIQICQGNEQILQQLIAINDFIEFFVMCCKLANPSVGDAITNLLLFQIALHYLQMNYSSTLDIYTDLKSKTTKISVKNKQQLKVTQIQDKVIQPIGLQPEIDKILQQYNGKKAFLRASGTQNVLRLHVQAQTNEQITKITQSIINVVNNCKELN